MLLRLFHQVSSVTGRLRSLDFKMLFVFILRNPFNSYGFIIARDIRCGFGDDLLNDRP